MGKLMNYGFPEEISVKSCNVSLQFLETFALFFSSIELILLLREKYLLLSANEWDFFHQQASLIL